MLRLLLLMAAVLLAPALPAGDACAVEDRIRPMAAEETDEDREFLESAIREAYRGGYRSARRDLGGYLGDFPGATPALAALGRLELLTGNRARALELSETWCAVAPEDPAAAVFKATALQSLGRYEEAEDELRRAAAAAPGGLFVRRALAELLFETGRRDEARALAAECLEQAHAAEPPADEEEKGRLLLELGRLFHLRGDLEAAARSGVLADLAFNGRRGPNYRYERYEALLLLGELYRVTRLDSGNRALAAFDDALKINPNHPGALMGRARTRLYGQNIDVAVEDCEAALLLNPNHPDALAFKAQILIRNSRFSDAMDAVEAGLSQNPRDKGLLAQKAACLYLQGDREGSAGAVEAALKVDPLFGGVHLAVGEALLYHYRMHEAREQFEKSAALDPELDEALVQLGRTLANLGLEAEAEEVLRRSVAQDPFEHPWRYNMLKILDELKLYKRTAEGKAVYALDVAEWDVLRYYLPEWFERSWASYEAKYGISPPGPILVEMFPVQEDFAVRTIGFSGLGALGACFGDVVTLLSPRAEGSRQSFVWARTLHHELAHVFTLKLSRHRIPRWLSEGFSVYEEQAARPTWNRDMRFELFNAYHNNALIPLRNFDAAFYGPRVLFAYYQAGLFVRFIAETRGWDALIELLRALGRDMDVGAAFAEVLGDGAVGGNFQVLDASFREWIGANILADVRMTPRYSDSRRRDFIDALRDSPNDADLLAGAAWACFWQDKSIDARYYLERLLEIDAEDPAGVRLSAVMALAEGGAERAEALLLRSLELGGADFDTCRSLGLIASAAGKDEDAAARFAEAIKAFPDYVEEQNPYTLLAELHLARGRKAEGMQVLEQLVSRAESDFANRVKLAGYYVEKGEHAAAARFYAEAVEIDPFVRSIHYEYGKSLHALKRLKEAETEFAAALDVRPVLEAGPPSFGQPAGAAAGDDMEAAEPVEDLDAVANILAARAALYVDMNRIEDAAADVELALKYNPSHSAASLLKEQIQK